MGTVGAEDYGFSVPLYQTQRMIIEDVSSVIENKQVGIISSPTGTGKTLALLSAAVRFMRERDEDAELFSLLNRASRTKIYYCSRTHSQLSQVLRELRRNRSAYEAVILGSRKLYCLNGRVNSIADANVLNEKCREQVREDSCPYYGNFYYTREVMDIEELKQAGQKHCFCPYYYAKNRASEAEIVFLPYSLLFTREGRKSHDIELADKILIVDEAHNIYDTVIQLNSVQISWSSLRLISAAKGLSEALVIILDRLLQFSRQVKQETVQDIPGFLLQAKLAAYNMFEIDEFIAENRLAQKNDLLVIFDFSKFLKLLTYSDQYGRVIYDQKSIKFTPINPGLYFQDIMKCRSIIFAGGTMEPIAQFQGIFSSIRYFSYPAVSSDFLALLVSEYPSKRPASLTFDNRDSQLKDLLNFLITLSNPITSGGVVFFLPSKAVLDMIRTNSKIRFFRRKVYFEGEFSFQEYSQDPSILFAVMGGRLSEGINFSDGLCRLLVVVGVPYPSKSLELAERARFSQDYALITAMKTVNQTIGRAVRHKDDYAAIILLDQRYAQLRQKLSPWISRNLTVVGPLEAMVQSARFLNSRK